MQKGTLMMGLATSATGIFILLSALNVIPSDDASYNAPRWVAAAAGITFAAGGVLLLLKEASAEYGSYTIFGVPALAAAQSGLGLLIFVSLALIGNWIAFGPGDRQFSGSLSIGIGTIGGLSDEWVGRACFGAGAILMDVFIIFVLVRAIRRWLQRLISP